jgi:glycosyltransferase involved in cell wall biosynthesis
LPQFNFTIVGDGPERENLNSLLVELKLSNVKFAGNLNKSVIPDTLSRSQLFLFTSDIEGTPTSVLEAMAVGLPIISTNAGGLNAIIKDHVNGFIIEDYDDIKKYVSRIKLLHKNLQKWYRISENNKLLAIKYSWDEAFKNIDFHLIKTLNNTRK